MMQVNSTFGSLRAKPRCEPLEDRLTPAVTVRFDTSLDPTGFFQDPVKMAALQNAASTVIAQIGDSLTAITPSGGNTWTPTVINPFTQSTQYLSNLSVGANEIVIYVGGGNLRSGALGLSGGGAYNASGSQAWLDNLRTRGQGGVDSGTDFSTWGGMIGFNSAANWNFGSGNPTANQYDFDSVATHELMHIFGFGLNNRSFNRFTTTGRFTGPNVTAVAGTVSMANDGDSDGPDHFAPQGTPGGVWSIMNSSIMAGQKKGMTTLEYATLRDIGWAQPGAVSPPAPATSTPVITPVGSSPVTAAPNAEVFAIGTGAGAAGTVQAYNSAGQTVFSSSAFASNFTGGVRVATGDVTGDGVSDYVIGAGPGGAPVVQVIDGRNGAIIRSFYAYDASFRGGVYVAIGDVTGDGFADIVTGAGAGGGPHTKVFESRTGAELIGFFGINDPAFKGGVRVSVGDIDGDGFADIVAAAGEGGGPRISVWSGRTIALARIPTNVTPDFFAYEINLTNGANVAVGDINGDGYADIVTGAGEGGGPRVSVFSGRELLSGRATRIVDFFTGNAMSGTGVRVAAVDMNNDGRDDLICATGPGGDGVVRVFDGLAPGIAPFLTMSNTSWNGGGSYVG